MEAAQLTMMAARRRWMSILAQADRASIESACRPLGQLPRANWLRQPETGLVMVQARIGGSGAKFNLGEVAVTRCAVRLDSGTVGIAWVRGRDAGHAELAARLDALLQDPQSLDLHHPIQMHVIGPLAGAQAARRELQARKAAATRVEFYTLAREAAPAASAVEAGT